MSVVCGKHSDMRVNLEKSHITRLILKEQKNCLGHEAIAIRVEDTEMYVLSVPRKTISQSGFQFQKNK